MYKESEGRRYMQHLDNVYDTNLASLCPRDKNVNCLKHRIDMSKESGTIRVNCKTEVS